MLIEDLQQVTNQRCLWVAVAEANMSARYDLYESCINYMPLASMAMYVFNHIMIIIFLM